MKLSVLENLLEDVYKVLKKLKVIDLMDGSDIDEIDNSVVVYFDKEHISEDELKEIEKVLLSIFHTKRETLKFNTHPNLKNYYYEREGFTIIP